MSFTENDQHSNLDESDYYFHENTSRREVHIKISNMIGEDMMAPLEEEDPNDPELYTKKKQFDVKEYEDDIEVEENDGNANNSIIEHPSFEEQMMSNL